MESFYRLEIMENPGHKPQCYASFNLLFLLKGSATAQIRKELVTLKTHDFIFFNIFEIHQFVSLTPDSRFLLLTISEQYLRSAVPEIFSCIFTSHNITPETDNDTYEYFCRKFGQLLYHHTVHSPGSHLQCLNYMGELLLYVITNMTSKLSADSTQKPDERLYHALDYIAQNYTSELSLGLVAEQVGVHPQYFSRYFKQHLGISLTEYINHLRVVNSLSGVLNSDESLLNIALNSGYNNYKTYSIAFKKVFQMTPTEMRNRRQHAAQQSFDSQSFSIFSFFRKYWETPSQSAAAEVSSHNKEITLELDTSAKTHQPQETISLPEFCYSIGSAADLLRGDIQQQIQNAAKELPIHQLRLRNIFSDELFVYYETPEKEVFYNWQYLDMIYDFLVERKIKPYTELGFTPRLLASKQQFANWQHRPNVSFPRSLKNWSRLVENFLRHLITRYGEREVLSWKFNMWTSPDLDMKGGYWHESMESFFLFYQVTYNAVKNVHEDLCFGGPDFSLPNGFSWYTAFFEYCRQNKLRPDFLTVHLYAESFNTSDWMLRGRYLTGNEIETYLPQASPYRSFFDFLDLVNRDKTFHGYPIVISDWNNTYHAKDYSRDTSFMAAFIAYTVQLLAGTQVMTLGFRSLCDVNEDFFPESRLFSGGPGLLDIHGLKKASYFAFKQLNMLGNKILSKGENYLFSQTDTGYNVLLFHTVFPAETEESMPPLLTYDQRYDCYGTIPALSLCLVLNIESGHYLLRRTEISRESGSAYDIWKKIGAPKYDSREIIERIRAKAIPESYYSEAEVKDHLILNMTLPAHSVVLVEIMKEIPQQPSIIL